MGVYQAPEPVVIQLPDLPDLAVRSFISDAGMRQLLAPMLYDKDQWDRNVVVRVPRNVELTHSAAVHLVSGVLIASDRRVLIVEVDDPASPVSEQLRRVAGVLLHVAVRLTWAHETPPVAGRPVGPCRRGRLPRLLGRLRGTSV